MIKDKPGHYTITRIKCPECHADKNHFKTDYETGEVTCGKCGLVLRGSPCYGVVYPDLFFECVPIFLVDLH